MKNADVNLKISAVKLRKICTKKCKTCKGEACPNYYGYMGNPKFGYYGGNLNPQLVSSIVNNIYGNTKKEIIMDNFDIFLIYFLISITIFLTIFGGLLP